MGSDTKRSRRRQNGGVAIGIGIGTAIGVATGNLAIWLALGAALEIVFGAVGTFQQTQHNDNCD